MVQFIQPRSVTFPGVSGKLANSSESSFWPSQKIIFKILEMFSECNLAQGSILSHDFLEKLNLMFGDTKLLRGHGNRFFITKKKCYNN